MPRLKPLTTAQLTHLKLLVRWCKEVRLEGVDDFGSLVVTRTDARDTKTYAIRALGPGRVPIKPVRALTPDDIYEQRGSAATTMLMLVDDTFFDEEGQED